MCCTTDTEYMSPKLGVKRMRKLKMPYSPTHFSISDDCDDSDDAARTVGQSDTLAWLFS